MKIAVITGASSGIGREMAKAIDRRYKYDEIWLIARRADRLQELAVGLRNKARILPLDLVERDAINEYGRLLEEVQPEVSLLVNSAGFGVFGPFAETDLDAMMDSAELNSKALLALCRLSLPYMKAGSGIINIGSNSSWQPVPLQAVYGASKAFVLSLSRAIGRELRPRGIHVMCVCPGWIKTEFQERAAHDTYIRYVDRWYSAEAVAKKAMKDYRRKKKVSILGFPVWAQVQLVKHLPVDLVMHIWCRQQGIE